MKKDEQNRYNTAAPQKHKSVKQFAFDNLESPHHLCRTAMGGIRRGFCQFLQRKHTLEERVRV